MLTYYGTPLCPDCVAATKTLDEQGFNYTFIDITASTANLKAFLALRDSREEFAPIKQEGRIGIPCFVEDDAIRFTI